MMRGAARAGRAGWRALVGAWLAAAALPREAQAQTVTAPSRVAVPAVAAVTVERLVRMSPAELDQLYRTSAPGALPQGKVRGIPIVAPGSPFGPVMSRGARVVWQGKVFRGDGRTAVNRFFGVRVIQGNLYNAPSW